MTPVQLGSVPFAPAFGGWRPSPQKAPAYSPRTLGQARWQPQLGQAASFSKGADVLISMLAGAGAITIGLAALTVGIGSYEKEDGIRVFKPSKNWKWIGGITAGLGIAMILFNVAKVSSFSEMVRVSTIPTSQP